jgi:hypothetical protein
MAEVGLVTFAGEALAIAQAVLPAYSNRFSKHTFTQPQLLAILCLMRYEDWTFREAEVRLREHQELRQALGLGQVPDYSTLYGFMRRLDVTILHQALAETVRRFPVDDTDQGRIVAVDGTGLTPGSISTFFGKRKRDRGHGLPWRYWLKWLVVVDVKRRLLVSQWAKRGPANDCAVLRPLLDVAAQLVPVQTVLAAAEFDSERNHEHICHIHAAQSVIPAKRGKRTWQIKGVRAEMRAHFPRDLYRQRALVESVFSAVKRKLSSRAPGRSLDTQVLQALLLGLAYNIYRLRLRLAYVLWA